MAPKIIPSILCLIFFHCLPCKGQHPKEWGLPEALRDIPVSILVNHFPEEVLATPGGPKDNYEWYWKHTTSILAKEEVMVSECGAYLLLEKGWQLRIQYDAKQFSKLFSCPKARMKMGHPYTFPDNWRTDHALRPGWAAWYFIGSNAQGESILGWGPVYTSDSTY